MKTVLIAFAAVAIPCAVTLSATEIAVTEAAKTHIVDSGTIVPAGEIAAAHELPDIGVAPIFHLDASDTNGWTFAAGIDGGLLVEKALSKVGARVLNGYEGKAPSSVDSTDNNSYWSMHRPDYVPGIAALGGKGAISCGARGSGKVLLFDKGEDGVVGLKNIATVIAVFNSENGGGFFLGGGQMKNMSVENQGWLWCRGNNYQLTNSYFYLNYPLGNDYLAPMLWQGGNGGNTEAYHPLVYGRVYHSGVRTLSHTVGFNGGWEVVSIAATNNLAMATGLGMGARRIGAPGLATSGGQMYAEVVFYDQILSEAQIKKVEAYLNLKWFGRATRGFNGNVTAGRVRAYRSERTAQGAVATVSVPKDETLRIDELLGGRGIGAALEKTGAGTLKLAQATGYAGEIRLQEGTLDLSRRPLPSALPRNMLFHFDASDTNGWRFVEENAQQCVAYIPSTLSYEYKGKMLCASGGHLKPVFRPGVLNGRGVVDFLPNDHGLGASLKLAYTNEPNKTITFEGVTTVVALMMPRYRSASLVGSGGGSGYTMCWFDRAGGIHAPKHYSNDAWTGCRDWKDSVLGPRAGEYSISGINTNMSYRSFAGAKYNEFTPTNGCVMIDGVYQQPTDGYRHPGWQVLAMQTGGGKCVYIGCTHDDAPIGNVGAAGGMVVAEIAIYQRVLTEEELKDASAYLAAKWLGRETPGYAKTADRVSVPDVRKIVSTGQACIYVPYAQTSLVSRIDAQMPLIKTGGGTLEILSADGASNIKVQEGSVRMVDAIDVEDLAQMALDPALDFDVSHPNCMDLGESVGLTTVRYWFERFGRNFAFNNTPNLTSSLVGGEGNMIQGYATVQAGRGRYLSFAKSVDSVRSAYFVVNARGSGGSLLAARSQNGDDNSAQFDGSCKLDSNGNVAGWFVDDGTTPMITGGEVYTNGVKIAATAKPSGKWQLVELHTTAGVHMSGLGSDFAGGDMQYAEVLVYDRELTAREKVATRNYLMKKWFNKQDAELTPLPEKEISTETLNVSMPLELGGSASHNVHFLAGEGDLLKSGSGILSVRDLVDYSGTVTVASGTLRLESSIPPIEPMMPESKPIVHFDASRPETLTLVKDASGNDRVSEWRSMTDNGWKALPRSTSVSGEAPLYEMQPGLGGKPALRWKNYWPGMSFRDADNTATQKIEKLYSALWIVGAHEGGGFLLGSGDTSSGDWYHRGADNYGGKFSDALHYGAGGARTAEFYINDTRMSGHNTFPPKTEINQSNTGFPSPDWHFVSMRQGAQYVLNEKTVSADGLAYAKNATYLRDGRQRLAEVAVYTNLLTAAECQRAGYYLRIKWNLLNLQRSRTNHAAVVVSEGATLDLNGTTNYLASVAGAGLVRNGALSAAGLVADPTASLSTDGLSFVLPENALVDVRNFDSLGEGVHEIPIMTVADFSGRENLKSVKFTSSDGSWNQDRGELSLVYRSGILYVRLKAGMILIVR